MSKRRGKRTAPVVSIGRADGVIVCERCIVAATTLRRTKGLLGRNGLASDEGMLIRPASSIHTFFMRFPIDVVFLDRALVVRKVAAHVKPWRLVFARRAREVLELPAGEAARRGIAVGQEIVVVTDAADSA
jgi:uncharacterized membrane protein (UPF0127 family)